MDEKIPVATSSRMSRQRQRDTGPEVLLRRELHRRGFRFQVDHPLPGMPRRRGDIVFTRVKLAVMIDGCFWHACPVHGTLPSTRREWWQVKLAKNVERDRDTDRRLVDAGWAVLRFWEHLAPEGAADAIAREYRTLLG